MSFLKGSFCFEVPVFFCLKFTSSQPSPRSRHYNDFQKKTPKPAGRSTPLRKKRLETFRVLGLRTLKRRFTSQVVVELKSQALGSMVEKVGDFVWCQPVVPPFDAIWCAHLLQKKIWKIRLFWLTFFSGVGEIRHDFLLEIFKIDWGDPAIFPGFFARGNHSKPACEHLESVWYKIVFGIQLDSTSIKNFPRQQARNNCL